MDRDRLVDSGEDIDNALASIARALISPSCSIDDISDWVLGHTKKITSSKTGYIALIDRFTGKVFAHSSHEGGEGGCGISPENSGMQRFIGDEGNYRGLWGHCLNIKKGFYTNAAPEHPSSLGLPKGHLPVDRFLSVPALFNDTLMSQIALANPDRDYTDGDLAAVERISDLFALTLKHMYFVLDLRDRENRIRAILAATKNALFIIDRDGRILDINETMATRIGKNRDELMHTIVYELLPAGAISQRLAEEIRQGLGGKNIRFIEEHQGMWSDNRIFSIVGAGGTFERVAMYSHDITEAKQAEINLRQMNAELEREKDRLLIFSSILEEMDDCVLFTNLEGKIQYINQSCCKKLAYSRSEMQDKVLGDFQYPGDAFAIGPLRFFEDTKGVWTGVLSMKNNYGMKVRTSLKSTPVVKDNWVIGRIFVLREIL